MCISEERIPKIILKPNLEEIYQKKNKGSLFDKIQINLKLQKEVTLWNKCSQNSSHTQRTYLNVNIMCLASWIALSVKREAVTNKIGRGGYWWRVIIWLKWEVNTVNKNIIGNMRQYYLP